MTGLCCAVCCHVVEQMDRSDIEDDPEEEGEMNNDGEGEREEEEGKSPVNQLDFYQADPFAHCQSERKYHSHTCTSLQ